MRYNNNNNNNNNGTRLRNYSRYRGNVDIEATYSELGIKIEGNGKLHAPAIWTSGNFLGCTLVGQETVLEVAEKRIPKALRWHLNLVDLIMVDNINELSLAILKRRAQMWLRTWWCRLFSDYEMFYVVNLATEFLAKFYFALPRTKAIKRLLLSLLWNW
jgi:hypothetical protein